MAKERIVGGALASLLSSVLLLAAGGCAHTAPPAPGSGNREFNVCCPGCSAAQRPRPAPDVVDVRYLGTSGLYVEWRGHAFLTSPFFSHAWFLRVGLGTVKTDREAVRRGLDGLPRDKVGAIFVGHGHYDHLGDVPEVAAEHVKEAAIYTNETGKRQLNPYGGVHARTHDLEKHLETWLAVEDAGGQALPVRVMPLTSTHACQLKYFRWAGGSAKKPWCRPWSRKPYWRLKQGQPLALLIDLLRPDGTTAFRIYYQESASYAGTGVVPDSVLRKHPVDLAVLCTASHYLADGYPEYLLEHLRPGHVLATHYEDFFRKTSKNPRLVPGLTSARATAFLTALEGSPPPSGGHRGPENSLCGPSNDTYTLPVVGEWMRFRP